MYGRFGPPPPGSFCHDLEAFWTALSQVFLQNVLFCFPGKKKTCFEDLLIRETQNLSLRDCSTDIELGPVVEYLSSFFLENMKEYSVEDFKNVVLSDHAPILVEIADPN